MASPHPGTAPDPPRPRGPRALAMWAGVALGATLASVAWGGDGPVTARLEWRSERLAGGKANEVRVSEGVPDGLAPPAPDGVLRFGRILGRIWCCVDYSPSARLWVDLDMDGALDDETAIPIKPEGERWSLERTVYVPVPGQAEPFPLDVRLYQTATCHPTHVHVVPQAHKAGQVVLAGRLRAVALTDGNADLRFDDPSVDQLFVDCDGDGRLDTGDGSPDRVALDTPFQLGGRTWEASVADAAGTAVEFRPSDQTPPPTSGGWRSRTVDAPGRSAAPPSQTLETLRERYEQERSRPDAERRDVLALIGRLGTPEAFAFCRQVATSDQPPLVRAAAVAGVGYTCYRDRAETVADWYQRTDHYSVATAVFEALHYMDAPEREALYVKELQAAGNASVVRAAAQWLTAVPTDSARAAILDAARNREPVTCRYYAYQGARYLPDGPPRDVVEAAAHESYAPMQAQGLRDLATLDPAAAQTLARAAVTDPPPVLVVALAIADVLGPNATPGDVQLLLALAAGGESRVRERVRELCAPLRGEDTVKVLLGSLRHPVAAVRALAADVLAKIPERRTTDALLKQLRAETDDDAFAAICDALGEHGDAKAVPVLLKLAGRREPVRRNAAVRALARIGPGDAKVAAFLLKLLASKYWPDRIYALDAAAASGDARIVGKVIDNLRHDQWQVRVAAAQALGRIRVKAGIGPMIDRLQHEPHPAVQAALADALFLCTGQNFYDIAHVWRQWWDEHGADFEVPAEIPERPKHPAGGSNASFYGLQVISERLIFVIDQSGSMGGRQPDDTEGRNRLEVAVSETLGAVGRLKDTAYVNVIMFETRVHPWAEQLTRLTPAARAKLKGDLLDLRPMGGTNLYDALEAALEAEAVDTIFLLSDGAPGAGRFTSAGDILREVRKRNQIRRITINCVSIGTDSTLLRDLAAQNGGQYVRR